MDIRKLVLGCGIFVAAAAITVAPTTISAYAAEATEAEEADIDWENKLLVAVDEDSSLAVRMEASTSAKVVGKMLRGAMAEVVEQGEEWTLITSGNVEGYVKNEYCLFGEDAEAAVDELCETRATVTTNGVRLRKGAGTNTGVYRTLTEGASYVVALSEDTEEGWIAVEYGTSIAYICEDYVEVELCLTTAMTLSEYIEAKEAAAASDEDIYLLAALIQCEAGGECYAGKLAVGAVVMNRINSSSFPNTLSGVIYQKGQFTPASSGKLARVLSSGNISASCYEAAKEALSGVDNTGGAKYFHAGRGKGTQIGNQVFY